MIKLVAFDWNGTLLSDTATSVRANNKVFPSIGLKPLTLKRYREVFEIPIMNYWLNVGLSRQEYLKGIHEIDKQYHFYYEKYAASCRSRAGVRDALEWLKKKDVEAIVYSNHVIPQIKKHFPRLRFNNLISHIIARQPGDFSQLTARTKSEKLHEFVKSKKLKPKEVITVGDSEEEVEIGKRFGYTTVAITGGWNSTARLKKHNPDFLIHNMKELMGIIKKLNKRPQRSSRT